MSDNSDIFTDSSNPLDSIEEVMAGYDWTFQRPTADELTVGIAGRCGDYTMTFLWQEEYGAMQFFCELDLDIPPERDDVAGRIIRRINQELWLGHFDIPPGSHRPCLRHTTLFRSLTRCSGTDYVADLIEIALAECEKYYNAFGLLASTSCPGDDILSLALSESAGEA